MCVLRFSFCLHTNYLCEALHPLLKVQVCGLLMVTSDWIFRNAIPGSKVSGVEVISRFAFWRACGESGTVFIDEQVTRDLYWLSKYFTFEGDDESFDSSTCLISLQSNRVNFQAC